MIQEDFIFDVDKFVIRHINGDDIYKLREFYSFSMDVFDQPQLIMYHMPMKALTPMYFEVRNDWTMDDGCLKYLCDGIILIENNDILLQNSHHNWVEKGLIDLFKCHGISAAASTAVMPIPIIFITHDGLDYIVHVKESNVELMRQGKAAIKFDLHDPDIFNKMLKAITDGD